MASINLSEYKKKANSFSSKPFTYVDLTLDLTPKMLNLDLLRSSDNYRDIEVSYDEFAIRNSLINIFNTIPGQRFLIPLFGCNLVGFLFSPISESHATSIGNEVLRAVELWEPRVIVDKVSVAGDPEQHQYDIDVQITIPDLKIKTNLTGVLTTAGFKETAI